MVWQNFPLVLGEILLMSITALMFSLVRGGPARPPSVSSSAFWIPSDEHGGIENAARAKLHGGVGTFCAPDETTRGAMGFGGGI